MDPRDWRAKYRSALLKINTPAIEKEISDAEDAIVVRTRELYQQTGPDVRRVSTTLRHMIPEFTEV
jgi:hypothetical protein